MIPIARLFYILLCFKTHVTCKSHEIVTYFLYKVVNHLTYLIQALELRSSELLLFSHILFPNRTILNGLQ